jgi:hypothetical protein
MDLPLSATERTRHHRLRYLICRVATGARVPVVSEARCLPRGKRIA